jgi:hypothetical protein
MTRSTKVAGWYWFLGFAYFQPSSACAVGIDAYSSPIILCGHLLKAKYFPWGNLLDTAFIQNTLHSWQWMHGLGLLKSGVIWWIGWWVSKPINPATRTCDIGLVRSSFPHHDVAAILAIKLTQMSCDDFVAWFPPKNDMLAVHSAYTLGMQPSMELRSNGQSSLEPKGNRGIWNLLWKTKVPKKLRVFA